MFKNYFKIVLPEEDIFLAENFNYKLSADSLISELESFISSSCSTDLSPELDYLLKEAGSALKFNPRHKNEMGLHILNLLLSLFKKHIADFRLNVLIRQCHYYCENEIFVISDDKIQINSSYLYQYSCKNNSTNKLFVYLISLGTQIIDTIRFYESENEIFEAYILNSLAAAYVELGASLLNQLISFSFDSSMKRFSPGYKDFSLSSQVALFSLLKHSNLLKVELSDSLLMIPEKSTSGIIL